MKSLKESILDNSRDLVNKTDIEASKQGVIEWVKSKFKLGWPGATEPIHDDMVMVNWYDNTWAIDLTKCKRRMTFDASSPNNLPENLLVIYIPDASIFYETYSDCAYLDVAHYIRKVRTERFMIDLICKGNVVNIYGVDGKKVGENLDCKSIEINGNGTTRVVFADPAIKSFKGFITFTDCNLNDLKLPFAPGAVSINTGCYVSEQSDPLIKEARMRELAPHSEYNQSTGVLSDEYGGYLDLSAQSLGTFTNTGLVKSIDSHCVKITYPEDLGLMSPNVKNVIIAPLEKVKYTCKGHQFDFVRIMPPKQLPTGGRTIELIDIECVTLDIRDFNKIDKVRSKTCEVLNIHSCPSVIKGLEEAMEQPSSWKDIDKALKGFELPNLKYIVWSSYRVGVGGSFKRVEGKPFWIKTDSTDNKYIGSVLIGSQIEQHMIREKR